MNILWHSDMFSLELKRIRRFWELTFARLTNTSATITREHLTNFRRPFDFWSGAKVCRSLLILYFFRLAPLSYPQNSRLEEILDRSGANVCKSFRYLKMLQDENLLNYSRVGFDTAENEHCDVCPLSVYGLLLPLLRIPQVIQRSFCFLSLRSL